MTGVQLRPAVSADATNIAQVHVASWQAGYAGILPADYLAELSVADRAIMWQSFFAADPAEHRCVCTVAIVEDQIVGFATTGPDRTYPADQETGELWSMYVDPTHWGSQVAKELIAAARRELRSGGRLHNTLWVLTENLRARRFYEREGWSNDDVHRVDELDDLALDHVRYSIELGALI